MIYKTPVGANQPCAWICTNNQKDPNKPSDRGRKKINDGKIYLDDSQNFEIEIHNPLTDNVLATININGKPFSKTGLVIKPGQRVYLDCFPDDRKKFVFSTYEVENTDHSKKAIIKNGTIEVFFFKESVVETTLLDKMNKQIDHHHHYRPQYYPVYYPYPGYDPYWKSPYWYGTGSPFVGTTTGTYTTNLNNTVYSTSNNILGNGLGIVNNSATYTCNEGNFTTANAAATVINTLNAINNIETGRIEKGEMSNQKFTEIDVDFENNHISHVCYQLLPNSRKPLETIDLKEKCFCTDCGKRAKTSDNFCSSCGKKFEK
jgi:hypothetical protein